jgi:hypothetical protein
MRLSVADCVQDPLTSKHVLLVADSRAGCVRVLKSSDGSVVRVIGDKVLKAPAAVAVTQHHPITHVIVGDSGLGSVCIFSLADGALLARIGTKGFKQGKKRRGGVVKADTSRERQRRGPALIMTLAVHGRHEAVVTCRDHLFFECPCF